MPQALSAATAATAATLAAFAKQQRWCDELGSPFNAALLGASIAWLQDDEAALAAIAEAVPQPLAGAVALRWAGALHALARAGLSPWSALWPDAEGRVPAAATAAALRAACQRAWREQPSDVQAYLSSAPQTNEVMRSAVLWPGLLHLAQRLGGLPLRLLELGSSAGLNLFLDRYAHDHGAWASGVAASPVRLATDWRGPVPAAAASVQIVSRRGCDLAPIDLGHPAARERLLSYVWPDQALRLQRSAAALQAVAAWRAAGHAAVDTMSVLPFLQQHLHADANASDAVPSAPTAPTAAATVVMHSIVWQYIAAPERQQAQACIESAGARAHRDAPLAWLRMEPDAQTGQVELRCRLWPGGQDERLAWAHPHGAWVQWLGL